MARQSIFAFLLASLSLAAQTKTQIVTSGLHEPVEVIRDQYGVNHIYAKDEHDLFFAQGYCAAKDRTFQFEMWRRQATGTVSEILGAKELKRDIGARLFKFRGNLKQEFNHYHPRGELIITAFTDGVNAYVKEALASPEQLSIEFRLLGIRPGYWTPDVVISRHQGLLGNLSEEVSLTRAVAAIGEEKVKDLIAFEPGNVQVALDPAINKNLVNDNFTEPYDAFRKTLTFTPKDLQIAANPNLDEYRYLAQTDEKRFTELRDYERQNIGSNNWIVGGELSQSGYPLLANDPHRALSAPSLRYMVHLNAPGWNVVGGGEPTIPGVSIGHNEYGAWGLTVFSIDAEDVYVYELNPANQNQYKYQGRWEDMRVIRDTIKIKNASAAFVDHHYTRHGPVTMIDSKNNIAYAIRCGWMEVGGAPYMASLRIDQATNWDEFREACSYSHIPGENMIWADQKGNIGWQAVGIAPIRKNWDGLTIVPGDGRYEWSGYLPIQSLPHVYNPSKGFWATANENLVPFQYDHNDAVGKTWADTYRADRINEVLGSGKKHSLTDMMRLQFDYHSIPARTLVPFLKDLKSTNPKIDEAKNLLLNWNFTLDKNSIEAGIYMAWEKQLTANMRKLLIPESAKAHIKYLQLSKVINWLTVTRKEFGTNPIEGRNQFLLDALGQAVDSLTKKLGPDKKKWQYGQTAYHHVIIKHPLSNAVDPATRKKLEAGPWPRGGGSATPGMTTNTDNQTAGASFRIAVDVKDWDSCMFTNTPGQSGNSESPFYKNLFELWANDQHFPVYFTREKILSAMAEQTIITPK